MSRLFSVGRRRILGPDQLFQPLRDLLVQLTDLIGALGAHLSDEDWNEAATKLAAAIEELKKPGARALATRAIEESERDATFVAAKAEHDAHVRELDDRYRLYLTETSNRLRAAELERAALPRVIRAPRKGQAVVRDAKRHA